MLGDGAGRVWLNGRGAVGRGGRGGAACGGGASAGVAPQIRAPLRAPRGNVVIGGVRVEASDPAAEGTDAAAARRRFTNVSGAWKGNTGAEKARRVECREGAKGAERAERGRA